MQDYTVPGIKFHIHQSLFYVCWLYTYPVGYLRRDKEYIICK